MRITNNNIDSGYMTRVALVIYIRELQRVVIMGAGRSKLSGSYQRGKDR